MVVLKNVGYDMVIEDVSCCRHAEVLHFKTVTDHRTGGMARINMSTLFYGYWANTAPDVVVDSCGDDEPLPDLEDDTGTSSHCTAAELLARWGCNVNANDVPVLLVPEPILFLVEKKMWSHLFVLVRWHCRFYRGQHRGAHGNWAASGVSTPSSQWGP